MKKGIKNILMGCLILVLTAGMNFDAKLTAYGDNGIYTVTGDETPTFITGVINGTEINGNGNPYEGIYFPSGTHTISLTADMNPQRDFSLETASGASVTVDRGFNITTTTAQNITFQGSGSFTIDGPTRGIYVSTSGAVVFNFTSGSFFIKNTTGYGIYNRSSSSTINISGGYFEISNCSINGAEGGLEFDDGSLNITNGATVVISGNGYSSFGDFYSAGNMTTVVSGTGTTLTINSSASVSNSMVLGGSASLVVENGAVITVHATTTKRGINGGSSSSNNLTVRSGATLTVIGGSVAASGIRRINVTVSGNSTLDVSGFDYALDESILNASGESRISIADNTKGNSTDSNSSVIGGGSVYEASETSIINGIMNTSEINKPESNPVNVAGEKLMRFDLVGFANSAINIAADPENISGHPAYIYQIGNDHSGIAYVWAPGVTVTFWSTEADFDNNLITEIIQTNYTIRGNTIATVGGMMPADPTASSEGHPFLYWVDAENGEVFNPSIETISKNINVYAVYGTPIVPPVVPGNPPATGVNSQLSLFMTMLILGCSVVNKLTFGFHKRNNHSFIGKRG